MNESVIKAVAAEEWKALDVWQRHSDANSGLTPWEQREQAAVYRALIAKLAEALEERDGMLRLAALVAAHGLGETLWSIDVQRFIDSLRAARDREEAK